MRRAGVCLPHVSGGRQRARLVAIKATSSSSIVNMVGFPAMPEHDPTTPDDDGFAHVRFTDAGMELTLAGGQKVEVPNRTIAKGSIRIVTGGDTDVNRVHLTLLASDVDVEDDAPVTEIVVAKEMSVARFELEAVDADDA